MQSHLLCKSKLISNLSRAKELLDKLPLLLSSRDISGTNIGIFTITFFGMGRMSWRTPRIRLHFADCFFSLYLQEVPFATEKIQETVCV